MTTPPSSSLSLSHTLPINQLSEDGRSFPLLSAAREGNVHLVANILNEGGEIDLINRHSQTALHLASYRGEVHVVHYLLEYGANPNIRDEDGYTPILVTPCLKCISLLLQYGADPTVVAEDEMSLLASFDGMEEQESLREMLLEYRMNLEKRTGDTVQYIMNSIGGGDIWSEEKERDGERDGERERERDSGMAIERERGTVSLIMEYLMPSSQLEHHQSSSSHSHHGHSHGHGHGHGH